MELVSIITPCYNSSRFLDEVIQSVLNQTYTHWEWIIVDDNSSDNSLEIINKYIHDERICVIINEKNEGASVSRNIALERAKGRFITFIDSDDLWLPHFLEKTIDYLIKNNEELVYTSYQRLDEELYPYLDDFIAEDMVDYNRLLYNCPLPMLTSIYDSNRIGKIKFPLVDKREDHAMWFEVLKKIKRARAINESLGIYRIRENSYSSNKLMIAKKQFFVYHYYLKLPFYKSIYYTICWAINGLIKYGRI